MYSKIKCIQKILFECTFLIHISYSYLSKVYLNIPNKFTIFVEKLIIDIFSMNTAVIYARVSSTGDRQTTERQVTVGKELFILLISLHYGLHKI